MNKKNNTVFVVAKDCIQDGRAQYLPGDDFTPATNGYALELLQAGIIQPKAGKLPKPLADALEPEQPADEPDADEADQGTGDNAPAEPLPAQGDQ